MTFCKNCGAELKIDNRKFCCRSCYDEWQKTHPTSGTFKIGRTPWNEKGTKRDDIKGENHPQYLPLGTEKMRFDTNSKSYRYWVKIENPDKWKRRSIVNWEKENKCKIPDGYVVHHKDENMLNDDPKNLEALTREEHIKKHKKRLDQFRWPKSDFLLENDQ